MDRRGLGIWKPAIFIVVALLVVPAVALGRARKATRPTPVPPGFVGMVLDGPVWPTTEPGIDLGTQLDQMVGDGVEGLRMTFDWAAAQPYGSWTELERAAPANAGAFTNIGGVPTNFGPFDNVVGLAAQRGLTVLPVILDAPAWDAKHPPGVIVGIPARDGPYASFVKALVQRYGPHGTFWSANPGIPKVPIRMWQIWNEPNIPAFWFKQPFARSYVALLRAAHAAIKATDPGAKVVLAGLPNYSWVALSKIYAIRGARNLFDVVAVHPYTKLPEGVITILTRVREAMDQNGDARMPMLADEVSWPSSKGKTFHNVGYDFATTEAGQARNLAVLLPMLGRERKQLGLVGFYYYTWATTEIRNGLAFDFAGLLRYSSGKLVAKPALAAFRRTALALESCRQKASIATRCARPG